MEKAKKKIRSILKRKHRELSTSLESVWVKAKAYQDAQISKEGHTQGTPHCEAVEQNLNRLIPDDKKEQLESIELFVLSAAACCHDVGKVIEEGGPYYADDHGERTFQMLIGQWERFGLTRDLALVVGRICRHHADCDLRAIRKGVIPTAWGDANVVELAAVFALADLLHSSMDRVSDVVAGARAEATGQTDPKTAARQHITGWTLTGTGEIEFYAVPETQEEDDLVRTSIEMMRDQLAKLAPTLKQCGYPCALAQPRTDDTWLESRAREKAHAQESRGFVGMTHYDQATAHLFVGRDIETRQLADRVFAHKVCLLTGESGVGKTSLILAGLFPRFARYGWKTVHARRFDTPATSIKGQICTVLFDSAPVPDKTLVELLYEASDHFVDTKILLALDQFEEILSCTDDSERNELEGALLHVASQARLRNVRLLISFRGDSQYRLAPYLEKICGTEPSTFYLEPLTRQAALEALRIGFESQGAKWDKRQDQRGDTVLDEIASDLMAQTEALDGERIPGVYPPFLQMVGDTLVRETPRAGQVDRDLFEKLGRSQGIIARYLVKKLDEFGEMKDTARRIAVELASAEGGRFRRSKAELQAATGLGREELDGLLERMVQVRLVRPVPGALQYELVHDSLARLTIDQLLSPEEREAKQLAEMLRARAAVFLSTWTMLSRVEAAHFYRHREQVRPTQREMLIILAGCMNEEHERPGWYWLRSAERTELVSMIAALTACPDPTAVTTALRALASLGDEKSLSPITQCLHHAHTSVRHAAVEALAAMHGKTSLPLLRELLARDDPTLRRAGLRALADLGDRQSLDAIRLHIGGDDAGLGAAAIEAVAQLGDVESLPLIRDRLRDSTWEVRLAAVQAIARLADRQSLPLIRKRLGDGTWEVRLAAVQAIGRLADRQSLPSIRRMLTDDSWQVRLAAVQATAQLGDKESIRFIQFRLSDPHSEVCQAAGEAIAQLGENQSPSLIREMLAAAEPLVRAGAVRVLARAGEKKPGHLIRARLKDYDWRVRQAAARAAAHIGDRRALPALRECLADRNEFVRHGAVEAVAELRDVDSLPIIKELLKDGCTPVRVAATRSLARLGSRLTLDLIQEALSDGDRNVRKAATYAFADSQGEGGLDLLARLACRHDDLGEAALDSLVRLDRRLYCPPHFRGAFPEPPEVYWVP